MEEKFPCDRHDEKLKVLFQRTDSMNKKMEQIEEDRKFMYSLDKNMALQTQMMKEMVSQNQKQDKRLDEQHKTIVNINTNLTELNEGQKVLNKRVGKLEERVEENEEKHKIDQRDIHQKGASEILYTVLYKIAIPVSVLLYLGSRIIEHLK